MITESCAKSGKSWLSSAVTRRHPINFPLVMQGGGKTCDLWVWSCYQMESSEDKMHMLVNCG